MHRPTPPGRGRGSRFRHSLLGLPALLAVLWLAAAAGGAAQERETETRPEQAPPSAAGDNPHGPIAFGCGECHTAEGWTPLAAPLPFDHAGDTGFALVLAHRQAACTGCHRDLRFAFVATACADCHRDPHRGELGLACESCHRPSVWTDLAPAEAIHDRSLFPLTGAHAVVDCGACHGGEPPVEFAITPTDCFSCHEADYRAVESPDHVRSGFPTACELCHTTVDFDDARFEDHDARFFPIFSGPHRGVWGDCSDCHTAPGRFDVFDCRVCHPRGEMDDEHDDVRGYVYESNACYACHPQGREDDAEDDD